jgi:hypothetical protein
MAALRLSFCHSRWRSQREGGQRTVGGCFTRSTNFAGRAEEEQVEVAEHISGTVAHVNLRRDWPSAPTHTHRTTRPSVSRVRSHSQTSTEADGRTHQHMHVHSETQ